MKATSVLIDARLPWGSGIGRYVRNIVPVITSRLPEITFTILVMPQDGDLARTIVASHGNCLVLETAIRPFSLAEQTQLPSLAQDYDLTWFTNYWVPMRWAGRFVVTVHDLIHLDARFPASSIKRFAARQTFGKIGRDAEHVVFVSRFSQRVFEEQVGTPKAATVVHHGIDHLATTDTGQSDRKPFALMVAAAKEHKNLDMLVRAWTRARIEGWELTLVTPADDLRSSIRLEDHCNLNVRRGIADAELAHLYATAGFVVVPSRYEGFGLPLLEAMRAGAPVISSTADALVEVAAGALIPFVHPNDHDGWVGALRDMAGRCGPSTPWQAELSRHNREIADSFTWRQSAKATANIIASALNGVGSG